MEELSSQSRGPLPRKCLVAVFNQTYVSWISLKPTSVSTFDVKIPKVDAHSSLAVTCFSYGVQFLFIFFFCRSEGGFRESVPLNNVVLRVDLPAGMNVCDIGTLTVWCRQVGVIFSVLPIPDATFVSTEMFCSR